MLFDILSWVRGSQLNESDGFSGSLPPLFLHTRFCIYFRANKYDEDEVTVCLPYVSRAWTAGPCLSADSRCRRLQTNPSRRFSSASIQHVRDAVRGSTDEGAADGLIAVVTRDCRPADTNRWAGRRRDARDNIPGLPQPARRISTLGSCRRPAVARVDRAVVGRGSSLHCPCSTMRGDHHPGTRYTCQLYAAQPATCRRNCTHALRDDMEKNFAVCRLQRAGRRNWEVHGWFQSLLCVYCFSKCTNVHLQLPPLSVCCLSYFSLLRWNCILSIVSKRMSER